MNYRIRFHPLVARDLDAIAHWVLDYAGPDAAARKLGEIEAAIATLKATPHKGSLRDEIAPGLRAIPAGRKAVIAFVVDDDQREVLIYAVTYGGADWAMRSRGRSRLRRSGPLFIRKYALMGLVFYDLETTGLSPAYNQPLQFAAIRTDDSFAEIERINLRCRIAPHIIPAPHALVVTGVTPAQLIDPALPTLFQFTQSIMELIERWAPATWVGFNNIRFDEEVLRQTFYQNLQPNIYATQFNGNNRLDILTAVYAVWCRNPGLLQWPSDDTGRTTFKLDRLAPANGFNAHNAHDALGDVEATLHIARLIANGDPALWSAILHNRDKQNVMATLETFQPVELVLRFGGGPPRSYVGCFCGTADGNLTQAAFFDLEAGDPEALMQADDTALFQAVDATPQIIRSFATNKVPSLFPITNPDPEHLRKAAVIAANPAFRAWVGQAMAARYVDDPTAPPPPVEKQIYGGFYTNADRDLLTEFQQADWSRRNEVVNLLTDPRLRQLGRRLIAFHTPSALTAEEAAQFKAFLHERWNAPDTSEIEWTTIASATRAIAELRAVPGADQTALEDIADFIQQFGSAQPA